MGRGKFNRALQILKLDEHLEDIGSGHGLIAGMESLFVELSNEPDNSRTDRSFTPSRSIDEDSFVSIFRKIEEEEAAVRAERKKPKPRHASMERGPEEGHAGNDPTMRV